MMTRLKDKRSELPSQTAGPYVHIGLMPNFAGMKGVYDQDLGAVMVSDDTMGERISISGRVIDGMGSTLKDAVLEIWQADHAGRFAGSVDGNSDPNFSGFGRTASDMKTGAFSFQTIKPGPVPFPDGRLQAPHITFWIVARGINIGLQTRMYFPEDEAANKQDPVLSRLEHEVRARTLVAESLGPGAYRFDIHLQGDEETVFFDV